MRITPLRATVALALVTGCGPYVTTTPAPTPAPGSRIRYADRSDSTRLITARLVSLDADSMVFERFVAGDAGGKWVPGSLPTEQVARLQVRVGRRNNIGRSTLIGAGVGLALGVACAASSDEGWLEPSDPECVASGLGTGVVAGFLIGALVKSDVLAPAALPGRPPEATPPPAVTIGPRGVGVRIPFRLGASVAER